MAAANCGINQRVNDLESKKLEIEYGKIETTIKDNNDEPIITINNLGYNAYDAMLIMKNDPQNLIVRSYNVIGYDGKVLDLGMNVELGAKIGKTMEEQTMKLMTLIKMTNERELLRWDFTYDFKDNLETAYLDETDFSVNYPILKNNGLESIALETDLVNFNVTGTSYYISNNNSFELLTTNNFEPRNSIIYYHDNTMNKEIPVGFRHFIDPDKNSYCIQLDSSSIADFTEELTITSNPTFKMEEDVVLKDEYGKILSTLVKDKEITFLSYTEKIMTIQNGVDKISFELNDEHILRLATGFVDGSPVQYCYIRIKAKDIDETTLKVNGAKVGQKTEGEYYFGEDISFPWASVTKEENFIELKTEPRSIDGENFDVPCDKILTKIDRGHLYTTNKRAYLDKDSARYQNINIINAMKQFQPDIKDEKEGEKEGK